jgi:hypothetical protein
MSDVSTSQLPAAGVLTGAELLKLSRLSTSEVYTANTISAQASDNSLNDSAAQFVVEGWFTVGKRLKIAGFTGDVGNNADAVEVVSVAAGKVVIAGVTLVDDAEGESVTLTGYESVQATAQDLADLAATSGPSVASRYVIDLASQTDGDPGAGKLRFNHATPTSATKIFLDDETSDGVDLSTALLDLGSSGYLRIQSVDDVGEWLYAKWTAMVDDTGYFDIAITVLASKGTLDDTDDVLVTFDAKGSAISSGGSMIISNPSGNFNRPADTTTYAAGELVANSTTAGSVAPVAITVAGTAGAQVRLLRARLQKSGTSNTNAQFHVHVWRTAPTVAGGDNTTINPNNAANYLGRFTIGGMQALSDGCVGYGVPNIGLEVPIDLAGGVTQVHCLIEVLAAYVPVSAETFTITLDVEELT